MNIARTSFTGAVTLSLITPPAGITATFNPAAPTTNSSVATINVANTVANGTYNLTITGAATGVPNRTVTLALTVAPVPDFTISANPTSVSAAPGGSANTNVTIVRTNLTADVALTLVSPPTGITGTFTPATLTGGTLTSALTINVGAGVATGAHNVTVQGVGGGVTRTTVVVVNVATSGGNLVWEFCNATGVPLRFWRLSGGTWAEVPPTVVGSVTRFSFSITSASGGVSYSTTVSSPAIGTAAKFQRASRFVRGAPRKSLDRVGSAMQASIQDGALTNPYTENFTIYAQASELGGFQESCPVTPGTVTKLFNVTGQGATEAGLLGYGGGTATLVSTQGANNVSVLPGTYDYLAIFGPAPSFPDLTQTWTNYRVGRGEVVPGAAVAVARAGAPTFATFAFTVTGGAGGSLYFFSQFLEGARGDILGLPLGSPLTTTGAGTAYFMSGPDRLTTDMNSLAITNTEAIGNNVNFRTSLLFLGSGPPAGSSFALPAAVPAFTTTAGATTPYQLWTVAGATPADYQTASSTVAAAITGPAAVWIVTATRAYLQANGQATNYSLATPILPGFTPAWAAASPLEDATVIMIGGNLTATPVAGQAIHTAFRLQSPP